MKKVIVNIARGILAIVLILSGFVKAVDPLGTQYKIEDYLQAMGLTSLSGPMGSWGALLFAIRRRLSSRLALVIMAVMTPLTLWLALANPISDCGCFGDAIVLTNWQTLWKNVILLAAAIVVARWPREMFRFVSESNQWIVVNYSVVFILPCRQRPAHRVEQDDGR